MKLSNLTLIFLKLYVSNIAVDTAVLNKQLVKLSPPLPKIDV